MTNLEVLPERRTINISKPLCAALKKDIVFILLYVSYVGIISIVLSILRKPPTAYNSIPLLGKKRILQKIKEKNGMLIDFV